MSIHIGQIIQQKVKSKRVQRKELYEKLNTSRQNLYAIFKRETIDTGILLKLCQIVNYNFFAEYFKAEPLKSMLVEEQKQANEILEKASQENRALKYELTQRDKHIKSLEETVLAQKKLIQLLEKEGSKIKNSGKQKQTKD